MPEPIDRLEHSGKVAELCALLCSPDELRQMPEAHAAAESAVALLRSGADAADLETAYDALDRALRRAGLANGLLGRARSVRAPGVRTHLKVAVCPGPVRCGRLERAGDFRPAPPCAVNGERMRKARLAPES
ncbi:hypothetical protein OG298_24280 [Streptomyces sp. NBC_01005]|uniref:hypothetical protein n=1 Tax=unclassified Streptomyces TaxID=2593676 RepID=UPI003868953D|nr:hypothetical protein OG298_24280 [Streptomyces sp. NBC_01005]WTC96742.1 hypothetical protein OH736_24295 [Streptomyces sp. NBC_01650]